MAFPPDSEGASAPTTETSELKIRLDAAISAFAAEKNRPFHETSPLFPFLEQIRTLREKHKATYPETLELLQNAGFKDLSLDDLTKFCNSAKIKTTKNRPRRSGKGGGA